MKKALFLFFLIITNNLFAQSETTFNSVDEFKKSLKAKSMEEVYASAIQYYDQEKLEYAMVGFNHCIKNDFKVDTCYFKLGVSYHLEDNYGKSIKMLTKAADENPSYLEAFFNMGAYAYENGDYAKSVKWYREAYNINDQHTDTIYGLSLSLYSNAQMKEARAFIAKGLSIDPEHLDLIRISNLLGSF